MGLRNPQNSIGNDLGPYISEVGRSQAKPHFSEKFAFPRGVDGAEGADCVKNLIGPG